MMIWKHTDAVRGDAETGHSCLVVILHSKNDNNRDVVESDFCLWPRP